jgi:hypothetical protein
LSGCGIPPRRSCIPGRAVIGRRFALPDLQANMLRPADNTSPAGNIMFKIDDARREIHKHELVSSRVFLSVENVELPLTLRNWNNFVQEHPNLIHGALSRDLALNLRLFVSSAIGDDGGLRLDMFISDNDSTNVGQLQRLVRFRQREVDHASAFIERKYAMQGLGSLMIRNCFALYLRWEMRIVHLIAGRTVGGYAWARMGWRPTLESWRNLRDQIRVRLETHLLMLTVTERKVITGVIQNDDPRLIWRLADLNRVIKNNGYEEMSIGKVLLLGTAWVGVLNLDEVEGLERLEDYLSSKGLLT